MRKIRRQILKNKIGSNKIKEAWRKIQVRKLRICLEYWITKYKGFELNHYWRKQIDKKVMSYINACK